MKLNVNKFLPVVALALSVGLLTSKSVAQQNIYAVTSAKQLIKMDTSGTVASTTAITGTLGTESIYGIDFRPATGELYALIGTQTALTITDAKIFTIDPATAVATAVSAAGVTLAGSKVGFDFNPTVDRIRVVTDLNDNVRFEPTSGTQVGVDTPLITTPLSISEVAYDRNFPAGSTSGTAVTTLFGIDVLNDNLVTIGGVDGSPSPNLGSVTTVGPLGVNAETSSALDLADNVLYGILRVSGSTELHTINPATGAATFVATIASAPEIVGMAVEAQDLTLTKVKAKVNFAKTGADSISITGVLPVPAGFDVTGKVLNVNFGGVFKTFTLDLKGKAKVGFDSVSVKVKNKKGVIAAQDAPLKINLKKGTFAPELLDEGFVNATVTGSVKIVTTVQLGDTVRQGSSTLAYKAKAGKTGSAK